MCRICQGDYGRNTILLDLYQCKEVTNLPKKCINLEQLDCSNTNIKIVSNFPKLKKLVCNNSQIKFIDRLPNLTDLLYDSNPVTNINKLLKLVYLNCRLTNASNISNLVKLEYTYSYHNEIIVIPYLPLLTSGRCWIGGNNIKLTLHTTNLLVKLQRILQRKFNKLTV